MNRKEFYTKLFQLLIEGQKSLADDEFVEEIDWILRKFDLKLEDVEAVEADVDLAEIGANREADEAGWRDR